MSSPRTQDSEVTDSWRCLVSSSPRGTSERANAPDRPLRPADGLGEGAATLAAPRRRSCPGGLRATDTDEGGAEMDVQVASGDGERGARGAVWTWTEVQGEADAKERETCSAPLQSGQVGDGEGPPESPGYRLRSSCLSPAPRPCRSDRRPRRSAAQPESALPGSICYRKGR